MAFVGESLELMPELAEKLESLELSKPAQKDELLVESLEFAGKEESMEFTGKEESVELLESADLPESSEPAGN